jgi:uncharacterized membrane protein
MPQAGTVKRSVEHKLRIWLAGCALAAGVQLGACSDDLSELECDAGADACSQGEPAVIDCAATAPAFQEVTAFTKCSNCHSSQLAESARHGAPEGVDFDSESAAVARASEAAALVTSGAMPPLGSGVSIGEDEKRALYQWAMCQ